MEVESSAPGKVFVLGEYGVALGAPAVVAAVDRRLYCRAVSTPGPGMIMARNRSLSFAGPLHRDDIEDAPRPLRFVVAAARVAARAFSLEGNDLAIATRSDLDGGGPKVGLGGSAAAVSAVIAAVYELAGRPEFTTRMRAALGVSAHRLAQGGGSGGDVVTSTLGGLQFMSGLDAANVPTSVAQCCSPSIPEVAPIALPPGLALEIVGTGESARTGPRVRRFVDRARDSEVLQAWTAGMGQATEALRSACDSEDADGVLAAVRLGAKLLGRLGAVTGIRVFTPRLRAATNVAGVETAVAVKPSGAGGGDCAIAVVRADGTARLRGGWRSAGLEPLCAGVSPDGARARVVREEG